MTGLCNVSFCIGPFVAVLIENSVATKTNKWAYRALFISQWGFGITSVFVAPFMPESVYPDPFPTSLTFKGLRGGLSARGMNKRRSNSYVA
jgi:hypothetical protein